MTLTEGSEFRSQLRELCPALKPTFDIIIEKGGVEARGGNLEHLAAAVIESCAGLVNDDSKPQQSRGDHAPATRF